MKIAFGIIVLNGDYVLEETLTNIYPYAHQILVAEGPVSYWQQKGIITSTVEKILPTMKRKKKVPNKIN